MVSRRSSSLFFAPLDIASLVCFRILFGAIMMWEVWRFFSHDWVRTHFIAPKFLFTYYGFDWVRPWPGGGMYVHFLILGVLALFVAVGFFYRISAALFFLGFTYVFLLDQSRYLNHFYLVVLMSLLLVLVPAHRAVSIDAWRRTAQRADSAPAWALWLLRAQLGIVYFYAGVAKLNADWLQGEPMRMWLAKRDDYDLVGRFVPIGRLFTQEWMVYFVAYGGLLLDLFATPLLLWKRTRPYAFVVVVGFHLTNAWLFNIGIFPWFMIAATLLFFPADWPRRVFNWSRAEPAAPPAASHGARSRLGRGLTVTLLGVYLLVQVVVPLRHFLYPGTVHWTEEGHRFAWHMKLRDKSSKVAITATDPDTAASWKIKLSEYLTKRQVRKMAGRPDMILQFCHHIAEVYRQQGHAEVEVRAEVEVSLNGRKRQLLIDPTVDLAAQPRTLRHVSWILPLETPLRGNRNSRTRLSSGTGK